MARGGGRFANGGRGRNAARGRGGGRFSNKKPDKNKNKSKNADLYVNGVFVGRNKDYPVVRASSKNQASEFDELYKGATSYGNKNNHLLKVAGAMTVRRNKDDFIPPFPDRLQYSREVQVQVRDVHNNLMTDALGNQVLQTQFVIFDPDMKEKLMKKYDRESDYGYKEEQRYKDGVVSMIDFFEGQIKESTWKRIERSSNPSSRKTFQEHAAA